LLRCVALDRKYHSLRIHTHHADSTGDSKHGRRARKVAKARGNGYSEAIDTERKEGAGG